jgi:moderate conductance mechanosensitive channel
MEQFMESTLYTEFLSKGKEWLISDFPGLLIVLILFFIAMKIIRISFRKLRKTLISRAERDEKIDTVETEKRINTLISITQGLLLSCSG